MSENYQEVEIPVPWGVVSGKWWGRRDCQPLLALHGWQDNAGTFDRLAPLLLAQQAVLCVDLPGHGLSSPHPPGHAYSLFWDNLVVVRRIALHFGWRRRLRMLGHSMGGAVAFLYAATYPQEVEAIVSVDIAGPDVIGVERVAGHLGAMVDKLLEYERGAATGGGVGRKGPRGDREMMLDIMLDAHKKDHFDREMAEILLRRGMTTSSGDGQYQFTRDVRLKVSLLGASLSTELALALAGRISCAVLNVRATQGTAFATYDTVLDAMAVGARRLERATVAGHHYVHLENATAVAAVIRDFFAAENNSSNNGLLAEKEPEEPLQV